MILGLACGIFFGEYCEFLQIIGDAFIKLLQMTILPYIVVSLILGIGSLTYGQAKQMAAKAGCVHQTRHYQMAESISYCGT